MNNDARKLYWKMRKDYWKNPSFYSNHNTAIHQWQSSKYEAAQRRRWERYNGEIVDDIGWVDPECRVRIRIVPDDIVDIDDLAGDAFNPDANPEIPADKLERERQEFINKVERDGVWGVLGEYWDSVRERWEHGDSCFGFVGDDWEDSGDLPDIMGGTVDEYEKYLSEITTEEARILKAIAEKILSR